MEKQPNNESQHQGLEDDRSFTDRLLHTVFPRLRCPMHKITQNDEESYNLILCKPLAEDRDIERAENSLDHEPAIRETSAAEEYPTEGDEMESEYRCEDLDNAIVSDLETQPDLV